MRRSALETEGLSSLGTNLSPSSDDDDDEEEEEEEEEEVEEEEEDPSFVLPVRGLSPRQRKGPENSSSSKAATNLARKILILFRSFRAVGKTLASSAWYLE